jgi:hypothetical protein
MLSVIKTIGVFFNILAMPTLALSIQLSGVASVGKDSFATVAYLIPDVNTAHVKDLGNVPAWTDGEDCSVTKVTVLTCDFQFLVTIGYKKSISLLEDEEQNKNAAFLLVDINTTIK